MTGPRSPTRCARSRLVAAYFLPCTAPSPAIPLRQPMALTSARAARCPARAAPPARAALLLPGCSCKWRTAEWRRAGSGGAATGGVGGGSGGALASGGAASGGARERWRIERRRVERRQWWDGSLHALPARRFALRDPPTRSSITEGFASSGGGYRVGSFAKRSSKTRASRSLVQPIRTGRAKWTEPRPTQPRRSRWIHHRHRLWALGDLGFHSRTTRSTTSVRTSCSRWWNEDINGNVDVANALASGQPDRRHHGTFARHARGGGVRCTREGRRDQCEDGPIQHGRGAGRLGARCRRRPRDLRRQLRRHRRPTGRTR